MSDDQAELIELIKRLIQAVEKEDQGNKEGTKEVVKKLVEIKAELLQLFGYRPDWRQK